MTRSRDFNLNLDRLKLLSVVELRDLLEDEERIQHIIKTSLKCQVVEQHKRILRASNQRLAEVNLSFQPYLSFGKLRLVESYLELSRVRADIRQKQKKMEKLQTWKPSSIQTLLRKKAGQAREQSEKLQKRFMGERMTLERFVESYQFIRKLYHIRMVKNEKMKDFLSDRLVSNEGKPPVHCCCLWRHTEVTCNFCGHVGSGVTSPDVHRHLSPCLVKMPYLPPLDCHVYHSNSLERPTAPVDLTHPLAGARVCGQPFRWPARPVRLQRLQPQPRDYKRPPK
ncbi:vacuolar protein sorting-associated protein 37B-like [Engraulis encrasicolus]|uniref:vacuolar protein sorting-associated protein 37B-like n=1 Tax=Engraulis encrasicolus TaxID=184585 RepID=UPI002FD326E3